MTPADAILVAVIPFYLGAACTDVAARIIPNSVPAALLAVGIGATSLADAAALWTSLGAGLGVFLGLALLGGAVIGGGDVKLAAASAVLLGAGRTLEFLLLTALAGGVLALVYLIGRAALRRHPPVPCPSPGGNRTRRRRAVILAAECRRIRRGAGLPYGVAIAAAVLILLAKTP